MSNLLPILKELNSRRNQLQTELVRVTAAIEALSGLGGKKMAVVSGGQPRRTLSVSARKRIAAAQRARWAKYRAQKKAA